MNEADKERARSSAVAIATEAGALLMRGFRGDPEIREKRTASDLVTDYDERCETLLVDRLNSAFPDAVVVGEEGAGEGTDNDLVWYVDPIDGTSNFAHGHPYFCISLGLWHRDRPLVGVVHAPALGFTFAAAEGLGVTRNGERIHVSKVDALPRALLATGFPADRATNLENNYRAFVSLDMATHGVRRCASAALELCHVASGGYDGFWDFGLSPWDLAAGGLFVLEAGGTLSDPEGAPFDLRSGRILASNGLVHDALLLALAHARALPPIGGMP